MQDWMKRGVYRCGDGDAPSTWNETLMSAAPSLPFHTSFDNTKARKRLHLAQCHNMLVADHSSSVHIPSHFPVFLCFWFSQLFGCSMANLAHLFHTQPPPLPPIHPPRLGTANSHGLLRNRICCIPTMWHSIFFLNQGEERKYYYNNNNKMLCEMWPLWYGKEDVGVMSTIARWTKK
jgi:hypothetical protein